MTITLATLPQATAQEVYSQVRKHLLTQRKRSQRPRDFAEGKGALCMYHHPDGTKCAAGCLIGDEEYSADMEMGTWGGLVLKGKVPNSHKQLISRLQNIHDMYYVEDWRVALDSLAQEFGLRPE